MKEEDLDAARERRVGVPVPIYVAERGEVFGEAWWRRSVESFRRGAGDGRAATQVDDATSGRGDEIEESVTIDVRAARHPEGVGDEEGCGARGPVGLPK